MSKSEPRHKYPLIDHAEDLRAANGTSLENIALDAVAADAISADDLRISRDTLQTQAEIADDAGFPQLADNLGRASELTSVPNDELLRMYEMLRPQRSTLAELTALAQRLEEEFNAPQTAAMVREAAAVYQQRNLLRPSDDL